MILALINATKGKVSVQFYCFTFESHVVTAKRKCIHKLKVFENLIHYNRDLRQIYGTEITIMRNRVLRRELNIIYFC